MRRIALLLVFIILVRVLQNSSTTFVQGAASPENAPAGTGGVGTVRWFIKTVDSANDVGRRLSVAIDPLRGTTYVSYFNNTNKDLKAAKYVGTGGNCGANNDWQCEIVDSNGAVRYRRQREWGRRIPLHRPGQCRQPAHSLL